MNALEIIERVRAQDADVVLDRGQLVVRGRGERLSSELQAALKEHKVELLVALGAPIDRAVSSILRELRPQLPKSLRLLPDSSLLALVNWSIMHAWFATLRKLEEENRLRPDSWRDRQEGRSRNDGLSA